MKALSELFVVAYGNKLDMNKMTPAMPGTGVAFVGRIGGLNGKAGVAGCVRPVPGLEPFPSGWLTVALGGSRLLSSYVQQRPFYTAQNVAVLEPRDPGMPLVHKLYYAMCIRANAFRYSAFGREANRTLGAVLLPSEIPQWVDEAEIPALSLSGTADLGTVMGQYPGSSDEMVPITDHFDIEYGHGLSMSTLTTVSAPEGVNFVSRKTRDNGVAGRVLVPDGVTPAPAGTLSVALSATPLATFFQSEPYVTGYHVAILRPKTQMSIGELLWWKMAVEANKYRYSYGRQANRTLSSLLVPAAPAACVAEVLRELSVGGREIEAIGA
ncbi:restriction endonuclease subunit S [Pseudoclavibacter chungangensis]|uniref:Restriction endonuclease subunit S n=1 Tax=Pseudoclavibacter chungangensis TaxID=587635 RepID=A0A7J5BMZ0_9MICO|nr:restriction endonuclease subunit S [Pseudoclavibacter chungangensis]KAB1653255.1 restriction endonuclease subunit S [Pseudoclavibacter chungangensis]NYJ66939.1 hypothetical protein [Pseudoclavibacter chungangensis]